MKWNQSFLPGIETAIRKLFTLEFIIPKQNGDLRNSITVFRPSNLNSSTLSRSNSQQKLSQSLTKSNSMMGLNKFAELISYSTFFPDAQKYTPTTMQKQSFVRKNNSMVSELSQD
jgi:hypothetical protein